MKYDCSEQARRTLYRKTDEYNSQSVGGDQRELGELIRIPWIFITTSFCNSHFTDTQRSTKWRRPLSTPPTPPQLCSHMFYAELHCTNLIIIVITNITATILFRVCLLSIPRLHTLSVVAVFMVRRLLSPIGTIAPSHVRLPRTGLNHNNNK